MTTEPIPLPSSDKEYLELLMFKILNMKHAGQNYFARKMPGDEREYNEAKKSLNAYILFLKKKGYNYDRFHGLTPRQNELFK